VKEVMKKKSLITVAVVVLIGVVLTALIIRSEPRSTAAESEAPKAGPLAYPRGPHNGRLLSDGPLQVEITIYEEGVPPQFRVYAFDAATKPVPPRDVTLQIELARLGGRVDRIAFVPEADYLRGQAVVEEPHSFDVKVMAQHAGRSHQWTYSQVEGKVTMADDVVRSAGIEILTAGPRTMVTTLELPGEVKADTTKVAHVVPRLHGVVLEVRKQQGDGVRRGDLMAVINSRELADAKGAYIEASHHSEFTAAALKREESLWIKKISAEREYLQAKREYEEARLAEDLAGQKLIAIGVPAASLPSVLQSSRESLSRFEIRAPLDGTVTERDITVGEAVTADETIFVIADLSSVWVEVTVYAKDMTAVRQGQEVTVRSTDLDREATGKITYIGPLVGETSRAATARLAIRNPDRQWRPGMFVSVVLVRETTTIPVAVSTEGIQTFRDWQVVFVRYGDMFEGRPLELGRSDGKWVEVKSGLTAGERYAGTNSFAVKAEIGKLGATHDH
jgi:membrane fusion protein, heavy metal efflux system